MSLLIRIYYLCIFKCLLMYLVNFEQSTNVSHDEGKDMSTLLEYSISDESGAYISHLPLSPAHGQFHGAGRL